MAPTFLESQENDAVKIDAGKIAIVRLGSIGDVINTLPLLNRLRAGFPKSHITWVVEEKSASILEGHRALDALMIFPRKHPQLWASFVQRLRAMQFQVVLECSRILKSGVIALLSGAPYRVGFNRARCKESSWIFTNRQIPPHGRPGVMLEQYLEFADYLELPKVPVSWDIHLDQSHREKIASFLGSGRSEAITLNLGASKREKLWPEDYFVSLITRLKSHWKGPILLTGGVMEQDRAHRVARATGVQDMSGQLSVKELASLFERSAIVVSCDTGPLHLAVAMGAFVVGLYGPSDPLRTGPYGQANWVVMGSGGPQCRSCQRWCGDPYTPCMKNIVPDVVFDKIEKRLAGHSSWLP